MLVLLIRNIDFKRLLVLIFLCIYLVIPPISMLFSQDLMKGPNLFERNPSRHIILYGEKYNSFPQIKYFFYIYRNYISPIDGDNRCSFYPTCSKYAEEALKKHGLIIGSLFMFDRLQRCGFDKGPIIIIKHHHVIYDPLSQNNFWILKDKNYETETEISYLH